MPSIPAIVFILWTLAAPVLLGPRLLNGDGDPARHIRHGEVILDQGDLIRSDPFSFTKPGESFVGFEWGSQVLLALAHRIGGLAGVAALACLLIGASYALFAWVLLRRGVDPLLIYLTAIAAGAVGIGHWMARPPLFSLPLVVALFALLERPQRLRWWESTILFAVWANLHGAWLFGLILIGMYLAGDTIETLSTSDAAASRAGWARVRRLALAGLAGAAATLLTPYGYHLPLHVAAFFGDPYIQENTTEFFSPNFHWAAMKPFLAAILAAAAVLGLSRRALSWPHLMVLAGTLGAALLAQRNVTLFGLLGLAVLAIHVDPDWRRFLGRFPWHPRFLEGAKRARTWPWTVGFGAALVALGAAGGRVAGVPLLPDRFEPTVFPVQAVQRAREARLEGRMFHEFIWGGYILYAWPEMPVFIDGGTDFFGGKLMRTSMHIWSLQPGWRDSLNAWGIDLAMVRSDSPLAHQLGREAGWSLWHCDSTAAVFRRDLRQDIGDGGVRPTDGDSNCPARPAPSR
ncbi:MAG TPA: hypothetical protein VGC81_15860 [Candidatus Methylomirabilis sp.]